MSQTAEEASSPLLTTRSLAWISIGFVAGLCAAWGVSRGVMRLCERAGVTADVPSKWPLSLVETRLSTKFPGVVHGPLVDLCISAGVLLLFFVFVRWFSRRTTRNISAVVVAGFVFVLCTNLIHGPWYGLVYPHHGTPQVSQAASHYYRDALQVSSAGQFLREFEQVQRELGCHSRTHPPGAVLFYYALIQTVGHGAAVSIAIAALSVGLSGIFLHRVLRHDFDRDTCGYVTLLMLLMPAVQIYYCASLDAVIATCFLGVLLFLRHPSVPLSIAGMIVCLFCASFLTFAACFLVPVVVGFECITKKSVWKSAVVLFGAGILYALSYFLSGFNYLSSFHVASVLENPGGFLLFAEPVSYVMTRLENIGDIVVFFGPFLLVLFVWGTRMMRRGTCPELFALTGLGILTLLAMFLTGAFKTGETARACLFIYPYLMFPVAAYLHGVNCRDADRRRLLWLVFGQTLLMQAFAGYYW